jgi:hypothetical protein
MDRKEEHRQQKEKARGEKKKAENAYEEKSQKERPPHQLRLVDGDWDRSHAIGRLHVDVLVSVMVQSRVAYAMAPPALMFMLCLTVMLQLHHVASG